MKLPNKKLQGRGLHLQSWSLSKDLVIGFLMHSYSQVQAEISVPILSHVIFCHLAPLRRCSHQCSAHTDLYEQFDSALALNLTNKIMINDSIIQKFISDLGTFTCDEVAAFNYFRRFSEQPEEYMAALQHTPHIHHVNEKIWVDVKYDMFTD